MQHPSETPAEISLLDAQLAFEHWRNNRTGRSCTPAHLKALATGLLAQHKRCVVAQALGVNSTALKHWAQEASGEHQTQRAEFVELTSSPEPAASHTDAVALCFHLPNGIEISAQGNYTLEQLIGALSTLGARV